jgi:hypothetical protein
MKSKSWLIPFLVAALVASAGILAGGLALRPALAGGAQFTLGGITLTTCSSSSPCKSFTNNGSGPGAQGKSTNGIGLKGIATGTGEAVLGVSNSNKAIDGQSVTGTGVNGFSSSGNGVAAGSTNTDAISALSFGGSGVYATADGANAFNGIIATSSGAGYGVLGISYTANPGIYALAGTGDGLYASAATGVGGEAAVVGNNSSGNGADITGTYIGIISRTPQGTGFPFVSTDSGNNNLFYTDSAGDVFYHGGLFSFARTRGGNNATTYETKAAIPSIDDWGSAQLVNGATTVRLDPTFAQTLDSRQAYQVMLTPDADTRGLYVAQKTPTSFVVREVQGGRGSFAFDYHVYAVPLGHAGQRMTLVGDRLAGAPNVGRAQVFAPKHLPKHRAH